MLRVTLSVENEIIIDRVLEGIEERAQDLTPAWPAVLRAFRSIVNRAFAMEGSGGEPWQPLADSTRRERARLGYGAAHPILERTGRLVRSLVIGDDGGFAEITPGSLIVGTTVPYFVYHQSNKPRRRLPRRAPILLTMDQRHEVFRPIRLYLTGRTPDGPQREAFA